MCESLVAPPSGSEEGIAVNDLDHQADQPWPLPGLLGRRMAVRGCRAQSPRRAALEVRFRTAAL
jgi:hypothetical protein